jgi:hypothetical protein
MAFTHNRPTAQRHYAIAYEVKTNGTQTTSRIEGASSSESFSNDNNTAKSSFHVNAIHNGEFPAETRKLSTLNTNTYSNNGGHNGNTNAIQVTSVFDHTRQEVSRSTFQTGTDLGQDSGTGNVFGNGESYSASSTYRMFQSYGSSISERSGQGRRYFTGSRKRVSRDDEGNTGNYVVRTTRSNSFSFGGTTKREAAGTVVNFTTTTYRGDTTLYVEAGNTGEMPNGNTNDPGVTNDGDQTVTDGTRHEEAIYNFTTPTTIEEVSAKTITETTEVNFTYRVFSSDLLSTFASFYPIKTSTTNINEEYITISKDSFTTQKEILTNKPVAEYSVFTLHGDGCSFLRGGSRLTNGFVSGPSTTSVLTQLYITQPPLNQVNQYDIYVPTVQQTNRTGNAITVLNQQDNDIVFTSSEGTKIYSDFTNYSHPVNFNDTETRGYVYDSTTFISRFYDTGTTDRKRTITNTEDDGYGGSYELNGYSQDVTTRNFTRAGSDGVINVSLLTTFWSLGQSKFGHFQRSNSIARGHTIYQSFIARVGPQSVTRTDEFGVGTVNKSATLISFDKGVEGGVQYETSSDISGAIRGFKNATIAHEYITTTTLSQSSSHVSVNTASSESYESICHPILNGALYRLGYKLNRYATFLPSGFYGSIYSNIKGGGYNSDLGNVEFIHEADGSSIIKYAKNFSYLSTQSFNVGESATQTATSCAMSVSSHTNLNGLIKIENATDNDNYHRTVLVSSAGVGGYFGGFVFTNDNGLIANGGGIPYSFKAFDASNSSVIQVDLTDLGAFSNIKTKTLPANAMVFLNQTTVPFSREGLDLDVIDRRQ